MINKHSVSWIVVLIFTLLSGTLFAQTSVNDYFTIVVNDKCLLSTNTSPSPVSMTLSTSIAGAPISPASNSNMYLKVTSIVPTGSTRKITAMISSGNVPTGTILSLISVPCTTGFSQGTLGSTVSTPIILNKTTNQTIVDGIGSCYTGTSSTDGYQLTFTWQPDNTNYYLINASAGTTALTIAFTITSSN